MSNPYHNKSSNIGQDEIIFECGRCETPLTLQDNHCPNCGSSEFVPLATVFSPARAPKLPIVDDYIKDAHLSTRAPQEFHRVVFLTLCGTVLAHNRKINTPWGIPAIPNLYACLVAESTIHRKTTAISAGFRLMQHKKLQKFVLPTQWTPEVLITSLANMQEDDEKVTSGLCYRDEIKDLLKPQKDYMAGARGHMLSMYDNRYVKAATQKRGEEEIATPALSILGATTPEHAGLAINQSDLDDGFIVRWLMQTAPSKEWGQQSQKVDLRKHQHKLLELAELQPKSHQMTQEQFRTLQDWEEDKQRRAMHNPDRAFELALYGRSQNRALRFCVILQALWMPDQEFIDDVVLQASMALSDYFDAEMFKMRRLIEQRQVNKGAWEKVRHHLAAHERDDPHFAMLERDLARNLNLKAEILHRQLTVFEEQGLVYREGRGIKGDPKTVRLADPAANQARLT